MSSQSVYSDDDDEKFNPSKLPGDNVWKPSPAVMAELYNKLEKEGGVLELDWKCPGRLPEPSSQHSDILPSPILPSGPTDEQLRATERAKLLNMFEEDDYIDKIRAPITPTIVKTPKQNKTPAAAQPASFDKIYSRVSAQTKSPQGDGVN